MSRKNVERLNSNQSITDVEYINSTTYNINNGNNDTNVNKNNDTAGNNN